MAGLKSCCLFLSRKFVGKHLITPNISVKPFSTYHSYVKPSYLYFFPSNGLLSEVCLPVIPVAYSSLRHYGTEKIDTQKILETAYPQQKSGGGDGSGGQTGGEEEEERLKREASKHTMKLTMIAFATTVTLCVGGTIFSFGAPLINEDGSIEEDEFSRLPIIIQYLKRTYKNILFYLKMVQEPSRKKLLPEPLQYPYMQPPYTLVLELTDLLVHPEWTYSTGWRFKKRPGVDQFLEQVGPPLFEVVIYTAEQGMIAFPIINSLDPNGYIMYRLFRDATDYIDGHHVKNLDCLNRDLKRVIVVDWNPHSVKLHQENTFLVPRWTGTDNDTSLVDLAAFLRTIAASNIDDVRGVLMNYAQYDNPLETFRERQRQLREEIDKGPDKKGPKIPWRKSPF